MRLLAVFRVSRGKGGRYFIFMLNPISHRDFEFEGPWSLSIEHSISWCHFPRMARGRYFLNSLKTGVRLKDCAKHRLKDQVKVLGFILGSDWLLYLLEM